ncbi:MAG TPA: beta-1,6-N-acetylglucosaminyltransferase, partial [Bacteroidia bacterium]|nr:beta-1,6-N-acetylglucosaminyltransferase [Bacteroidia bacterium]
MAAFMKLTYIILAHRLPAQLARLVNALADENVNFAIHIDRKADEVAFRKAVEANGIYWVNDRVDIYWGGFSQVQATFNSLEEAMSQFPQTDYFIYLSGQDFPIKSKLQLHLFFNHTDGKSFMEYFPLPHESWSGNGGLGRITN